MKNIICCPAWEPRATCVHLASSTETYLYNILINLSSNCHIWLVASMWKGTNLGR